MMCRMCGAQFDAGDSDRCYERYPYGEGEAEQIVGLACPYCGCEDIREDRLCEECGGEFAAEDPSGALCPLCLAQLSQTLEWLWGMLSPAEQRWAASHDEWMEQSWS